MKPFSEAITGSCCAALYVALTASSLHQTEATKACERRDKWFIPIPQIPVSSLLFLPALERSVWFFPSCIAPCLQKSLPRTEVVTRTNLRAVNHLGPALKSLPPLYFFFRISCLTWTWEQNNFMAVSSYLSLLTFWSLLRWHCAVQWSHRRTVCSRVCRDLKIQYLTSVYF